MLNAATKKKWITDKEIPRIGLSIGNITTSSKTIVFKVPRR